MAPYDSDSSGGEEEDFTETNVLLGYASKESNGEDISRLGGRPDWIGENVPSAALARCKVCKDMMVLLLQLNGELPDKFPGHERRLYVFACRRKSCRRREGSIGAVRGVRVSPDAARVVQSKSTAKVDSPGPKPTTTGLGDALFGARPTTAPSSNPFAPKTASASTNPFAPKTAAGTEHPIGSTQPAKDLTETAVIKAEAAVEAAKDLPKSFAQTLSLNNTQTTQTVYGPPEPWPEEDNLPKAYPVNWLADAEYETLDPIPTPRLPTASTSMEVDSASGGGGKEDKEIFESSMDSVFQKFADRVGQNPEQCIRYEFGGQPLLYSKNDAVGALLHTSPAEENVKVKGGKGFPRCQNCGAQRVFEVQLTPHAIEELEKDDEEAGFEGMDWGTIIVAVCERDCEQRGIKEGDAGYVEEWAGVQWEELTARR